MPLSARRRETARYTAAITRSTKAPMASAIRSAWPIAAKMTWIHRGEAGHEAREKTFIASTTSTARLVPLKIMATEAVSSRTTASTAQRNLALVDRVGNAIATLCNTQLEFSNSREPREALSSSSLSYRLRQPPQSLKCALISKIPFRSQRAVGQLEDGLGVAGMRPIHSRSPASSSFPASMLRARNSLLFTAGTEMGEDLGYLRVAQVLGETGKISGTLYVSGRVAIASLTFWHGRRRRRRIQDSLRRGHGPPG